MAMCVTKAEGMPAASHPPSSTPIFSCYFHAWHKLCKMLALWLWLWLFGCICNADAACKLQAAGKNWQQKTDWCWEAEGEGELVAKAEEWICHPKCHVRMPDAICYAANISDCGRKENVDKSEGSKSLRGFPQGFPQTMQIRLAVLGSSLDYHMLAIISDSRPKHIVSAQPRKLHS